MPEVRGTADVGAYSPFRSILLVLTHDFIITCLRTNGQWRTWMGDTEADAGCAPFSLPFVAMEWCTGSRKSRAPYDHLIRLPTRITTG